MPDCRSPVSPVQALRLLTCLGRAVRHMLVGVACASVISCGGGSALVAPPTIEPKPQPPVLTILTVILAEDVVPASQATAARVTAMDDKGRLMTVGLIAWTSVNPDIATISPDGVILARTPGAPAIKAVIGEVEAMRTLTVTPPPPGPLPIVSLSLMPITQSMDRGSSLLFMATPRDFAGRALADREVTWTSSNDSIAIVSADGTVTGIAVGVAIIEATSNGVRSAASINITPPQDSRIVISVAKPRPGDEIGDTIEMLVTVRSERPLTSVVLNVAGRDFPMRLDYFQNFGEPRPVWLVTADLPTIVFGPIALVVNATDNTGRRGTLAIPVIRRPLVPGGNMSPPASK